MGEDCRLIANEELPEESSYQATKSRDRCKASDCIELIGYGRYHWKVVVTMGMISVAANSEIWVVSLISLNLTCEWNMSALEKAAIPGTFFLLMAIGSWQAGLLADTYGRKRIMLTVNYILTLAAITSAFSWGYPVFLVLRGVAGFCIGATFGISMCYSSEMVPTSKRAFNLFLLHLLWSLGGVYICVCAILVVPYHWGWRYLLLLGALPCLLTIPLLHLCDESVRFLAVKGRLKEVKEICDKIATQNKKEKLTREIFCPTTEESYDGILNKEIFKQPFLRRTLLLTLCIVVTAWAFFAIIYLLPDMMRSRFCQLSEWFKATQENPAGCMVYTNDQYIFLIIVNLLFLPGFVISPITSDLWGRKQTIWYSYFGGVGTTWLLLLCTHPIVIYIDLFLTINFYVISNATLWLYIPENYPTNLRSSATGAHNCFAKFGAALGTFLTEYLDTKKTSSSIIVLVAVLVLTSLASLFLPIETKDTALTDDEDERLDG